MKLWKPFLLQWWQVGIFKTGLLAAGIAIGAYWSTVFVNHILALSIVAAGCFAYIGYVRSRQL